MPRSYIVDSSALVAYLDQREQHHEWAEGLFGPMPTPWLTCDAALAESFYLLKGTSAQLLKRLLRSESLRLAFDFHSEMVPVLDLMDKYADVPMSLADACLVRMTEILPDPVVLTTDHDFRLYRRHSRQVIPCRMP